MISARRRCWTGTDVWMLPHGRVPGLARAFRTGVVSSASPFGRRDLGPAAPLVCGAAGRESQRFTLVEQFDKSNRRLRVRLEPRL